MAFWFLGSRRPTQMAMSSTCIGFFETPNPCQSKITLGALPLKFSLKRPSGKGCQCRCSFLHAERWRHNHLPMSKDGGDCNTSEASKVDAHDAHTELNCPPLRSSPSTCLQNKSSNSASSCMSMSSNLTFIRSLLNGFIFNQESTTKNLRIAFTNTICSLSTAQKISYSWKISEDQILKQIENTFCTIVIKGTPKISHPFSFHLILKQSRSVLHLNIQGRN